MTTPVTWRAVLAPLGVPARDVRDHLDRAFAPRLTPPAPLLRPVVDAGHSPGLIVGRVDVVFVDASGAGILVAYGALFDPAPELVEAMDSGALIPGFDLAYVTYADERFRSINGAELTSVTIRTASESGWPGVARFEVFTSTWPDAA